MLIEIEDVVSAIETLYEKYGALHKQFSGAKVDLLLWYAHVTPRTPAEIGSQLQESYELHVVRTRALNKLTAAEKKRPRGSAVKHPKCRGTSQDDCGYAPSITCAQCQFGTGTKDPRAACNSSDPLKGLTGKQRAALEDVARGQVKPEQYTWRTWSSLDEKGFVVKVGNEYVKS